MVRFFDSQSSEPYDQKVRKFLSRIGLSAEISAIKLLVLMHPPLLEQSFLLWPCPQMQLFSIDSPGSRWRHQIAAQSARVREIGPCTQSYSQPTVPGSPNHSDTIGEVPLNVVFSKRSFSSLVHYCSDIVVG
jgi:hypothetical protein